MRGLSRRLALIALLMVAAQSANSEERSSLAGVPARDTWYEFFLKHFNKENVDYGRQLELRREAFLKATIRNVYFDYSLLVTVALLTALVAYGKLWTDDRRKMAITAEMMTDILNQHEYSREAAKAAIEKYNRHIELCNRAMEEGEGQASAGAQTVKLAAELHRLTEGLACAGRERDKALEEVAQKSAVIAEMSLRIEGLSKKQGGNDSPGEPIDLQGAKPDLIAHINRLQQELYAERQKNKRLKGA